MESNAIDWDRLEASLLEFRRKLHNYPELGWREYRTSRRIYQELDALGIFDINVGHRIVNVEKIPDVFYPHIKADPEDLEAWISILEMEEKKHTNGNATGRPFTRKVRTGEGTDTYITPTGVVAILDSKRPGPTTMLRFDIDAFYVEPEKDNQKREEIHLVSDPSTKVENNGTDDRGQVMHACGHDFHAAMGVGIARVLKNIRNEINGRIVLVFQPAEEMGGGAVSMLDSPLMNDVGKPDNFFSSHVGVTEERVFGCTSKWFFCGMMRVTFRGRKAHAGLEPWAGINALEPALACATALLGEDYRKHSSNRVNVGSFICDGPFNAIPDSVEFQLDVRHETREAFQSLYSKCEKIIETTAHDFGFSRGDVERGFDTKTVFKLINVKTNDEMKKRLYRVARSCSDKKRFPHFYRMYGDNIKEEIEVTAGEDANDFIPATVTGDCGGIVILGGQRGGHHKKSFKMDESVLICGVQFFFQLVKDIHGSGNTDTHPPTD